MITIELMKMAYEAALQEAGFNPSSQCPPDSFEEWMGEQPEFADLLKHMNEGGDENYIPFSVEWEREIMKLPKKYIVSMLYKQAAMAANEASGQVESAHECLKLLWAAKVRSEALGKDEKYAEMKETAWRMCEAIVEGI